MGEAAGTETRPERDGRRTRGERRTMYPLLVSRLTGVNSLGAGRAATWAALQARRSGLGPCRFAALDFPTQVGEVADLDADPVDAEWADFDCRNNRLAQRALAQDGFVSAVDAASRRYSAERVGVVVGTSTSGLLQAELAYRRRDLQTGRLPADFCYAHTQNTASLAAFVQRYLRLAGPACVVSSACSSSAKVFGSAARLIAAGVCDAAVVGGVDTLCFTTLYGFHALGLLSPQPCRPYDVDRNGISLGEGAGFALLERPGRALPPGALALLGVGESSDAHHMSAPHPEGWGAQLAMQRALDAAGLAPSEIDYINLHGTATKTNDAAEDRAVTALFGSHTPCSSTKGWTGHLLGAAGITEALIAGLAIQHDFMPGSLHTRRLDPTLHGHYLLANRRAPVRRVLSNSFGFGGSNCSLVLGRGDDAALR